MNNLTARQFETFGPGKYSDGDNLHLHVSPTGQRRFIYSPRVGAKRPEYGFKADTLKAARLERDRLKGLLAKGVDPRSGKSLDAKPDAPTFAEVARRYIAERNKAFRQHTIAEWERAATVDCEPIASKPLDDITVADIKGVLLPIFEASPEKAKRVKRKIAAIFDYAADHELCDRDRRSPAEGRTILPEAKRPDNHHAALPYVEVASLIAKLRADKNDTATVLEFIALTACRSGEARLATWAEFDLDNAQWTIPATRMKARKPHVIPLAPRAVQILTDAKDGSTSDFAFPNMWGNPFSDIGLLRAIRKIDRRTTVHGLRSTFRDWAGDATQYSREIAEEALAHQVGNAVERAYRRGSALEKRRQMMDDWAAYCEPADNVVRLPAKKA